MTDPKKKIVPSSAGWLAEHMPEIPADATATAAGEQIRRLRSMGGQVSARTPGNLPIPEAVPEPSREGKAMGWLADFLPVLGEERALQAGHEQARQGHPLVGAGMALAGALPLVGRAARKTLPRIARAAIELPDGSIHWGSNHAAAIDAARHAGALPHWRDPKFDKILSQAREGFVDESGAFLDRDETLQRLRGLGSKLEGHNFSSEEFKGFSAKSREKYMAPDNALPHRGERPYGDTFAAGRDSAATRTIAAAAIRLPDGSIHTGPSHWPAVEAAIKAGKLPPAEHPDFERLLQQAHEGFTDNSGKFVSRSQAFKIANSAKQIESEREAAVRAGKSVGSEDIRMRPDSVVAKSVARATPDHGFDRMLATADRIVAGVRNPQVNGQQDAARILAQMQKTSGGKNLPRVTAVSQAHAKRMAQIYESLPKHDPEARAAYDALNAEVEKQHQAITNAGHTIEYVDSDPYKSSKDMIADVRDNKRLKVFKTPRAPEITAPSFFQPGKVRPLKGDLVAALKLKDGRFSVGENHAEAMHGLSEDEIANATEGFMKQDRTFLDRRQADAYLATMGRPQRGTVYAENLGGHVAPEHVADQWVPLDEYFDKPQGFHPYMTPEQNDRFRAVHDWLAHAGEGHSFGPIGEENAYRVHSSTLSPLAQRALATETRGQNSWVNFGPQSHLPVTKRPYAEQKAALWPAEFTGDYGEMPLGFDAQLQALLKKIP